MIYWNGQRAIQNRRELISVKQLRLRLWNKKYFFRMLRYGQFGIRRLSQSQVLSAKKLQYLIDNQWKGKDPNALERYDFFERTNDTKRVC